MSLIINSIKSQEIVNHIHTRFEPRYFINKKILERAVLKSRTVMLGDIALLKSGSTPDHSNEINKTYKVPFIKSAQIKKNQIDIDNLSFITEDEHQRRNNMHLKEDDILMYAIEEDARLDLNFSVNYINMMVAFSKINKKVQIHISEAMPMKIQYGMDTFMDNDEDDEEDEDKNYIRFFLAPKIED